MYERRQSLIATVPLVACLACFAAVLACSANKPNPPVTPMPPADAGSDAQVATVSPEGGVSALPPDAGGGAGPVFFTDAGSSTAPAVSDQALDMAIDLAITTAAPKVAARMDREGQPGRATLRENEHFSMMVTLSPNRCYTFVGFSPPGAVSQLDMKLYGPPFFNVEAGKSSAGDKAMPVIGKGAAALCPVAPIPVPYKLDVVATKGAGRIGVNVFARNK
jgi:hypothetical protein